MLAHEGSELGAAPHGEIEAQALDRLDETGWADRLAQARRPAAARLEALLPAIKIGARLTDRARRAIAGEPIGHRSPPSRYGVASSLRFDIRGLRSEKTRRRPGVSDNMSGQAINLHGGLLRLVDSQLSASETPSPFSNCRLISV